ncbi:DNA repair protein RadC [uncultured Sneathia sp.]|jgi:hypothetical protein|uniref:JAB domain-containing protein n=1 Tax=uncultured Sneathia sp. TaxID=278067 RepID=UPI002595902B|nr:DNA repair protein RadC [uncultured Sneathia sp.]
MNITEKFLKYGSTSLEQSELLEVLLYLAGVKNAQTKSKKLLEKYADIYNILAVDNNFIENEKGINIKFLILKKLINDFCSEIQYYNLKSKGEVLNKVDKVVEFFKKKSTYMNNEYFNILFLNINYEIICYETVSKGTIDRSIVFMRTVISKTICCNAKNIIITHNHPSGNIRPSQEDIKITHKILEGLKLFDINLIDHIIVGKNDYFSFVEGGLL